MNNNQQWHRIAAPLSINTIAIDIVQNNKVISYDYMLTKNKFKIMAILPLYISFVPPDSCFIVFPHGGIARKIRKCNLGWGSLNTINNKTFKIINWLTA